MWPAAITVREAAVKTLEDNLYGDAGVSFVRVDKRSTITFVIPYETLSMKKPRKPTSVVYVVHDDGSVESVKL